MFEGMFQPMHLLLIVGIAMLFFGPRKLPELGRGLGDGIRAFKESILGDVPAQGTPAAISPTSATPESSKT